MMHLRQRFTLNLLCGLMLTLAASLGSLQAAAPKTVLMYGPTLYAGTPNEQTIAQAAGYTVTVASASQWAAMTTQQFASYNAIVFPEPYYQTTTALLATAEANKATWSAAVQGPIVVIGEDVEWHTINRSGTSSGAAEQTMSLNAINYAAKGSKTGLYMPLSGYYNSSPANTPVSILNPFGQFLVQGASLDSIHIIDPDPNAHIMAGLTDTTISNWGESTHEQFNRFPAGFTPLAIETTTGRPYIIVSCVFPSSYSITDLGALGGSSSRAFGVNSPGTVVGTADTGNGWHAFQWTPTAANGTTGHMTDLGTLPQGVESIAFAINDSGQIAGSSYDLNQGPRGFLDNNGTMTDLTTLGGSYSNAFALNTPGLTAGQAMNSSQEWHGITAQGGSKTDLQSVVNSGIFFHTPYSCAYSINDNGEVAGQADTSLGDTHAFFDSPATGWSDLGVLYGGTYSSVFSLTFNDLLVGEGDTLLGDIHAAFWYNGTVQDLGTLPSSTFTYSSAAAVNPCNLVVGISYSGSDPTGVNNGDHAVCWVHGQIIDLNTMIPANSGWVLEKATAVNGSDQIAGYGLIGGQEHAFLLTPTTM